MTSPLTPKQKEVFEFISRFLDRHDYAPSFREIAEAFNFSSVATVANHINTLKTKGYLTNTDNLARSIQLTPTFEAETFQTPLLGSIAAGEPIQAIRTHETIDIPRDMAQKDVFALKVRGDSMIGDGILDGDYVVVKKITSPRNGDIVVSMLDGENVTLKRFFKEKNRIRLQPSNSKYKPIYTNSLTIQGKVLGVIRKFAN